MKHIALIATSVLILSANSIAAATAADKGESTQSKSSAAQCTDGKTSQTKGADEPDKSSSRTACMVSTTKAFESTDPESARVIKVIENITAALSAQDFTKMAEYMDEHCTTYNASTKTTIQGRENVISDVKKRLQAEEARDHVRALSFKIDRPFAKVNGDDAVACFVLVKEIGGAHPKTYEEHCTDVFIKRDNEWKKLQFRGDAWKRVK